VKVQSEKNDDEHLRDLYMSIDQYLQVIANMEATMENPFPKGQGTIKQVHLAIDEKFFMNN
jgi:hypothetical protein